MFKSTILELNQIPKSCIDYLNNRFNGYKTLKQVQIIYREDKFDYVLALLDDYCLNQDSLLESFECIKSLEETISLKKGVMTTYLKRKLKIKK